MVLGQCGQHRPELWPRFPFLERKPFKRNKWESAVGTGND